VTMADMPMKADYDRIVADWIRARQALPPLDQTLIESFIEQLPPGARVLDLGCGTGHPIASLLARHAFAVHGVDRSAALLAEAQRNVAAATFEQAELEDYAIPGTWQGIICFDALFHLPRAAHEPLLRRIFRALDQGGVLLLTSGGSIADEGPFTDTMFGVEFYYDAFPREELIERCTAIGYRVLSRVMLNEPNGARDKGRLGLLLGRPAN
jgi:SAM-dependent methyltransferase